MHYARAKKAGTLDQYSKRSNRADSPCKLDECNKPGYALGYCQRHYDAYHLHGDPISPAERKRLAGPQMCAIDGCDRRAHSKGMCARHYSNQRRYGHAIPVREWPLEKRLEASGWSVTDVGCWEWKGSRNEHGYGLVTFKGRVLRAHRAMYETRVGALDGEQVVRHRCDNPPCVNPVHLELGCHADNMNDMATRGRAGGFYENTEYRCPNGHDMTLPGAYKIVNVRGKKSYRTCVTCARTRSREYARRRREKLSGV